MNCIGCYLGILWLVQSIFLFHELSWVCLFNISWFLSRVVLIFHGYVLNIFLIFLKLLWMSSWCVMNRTLVFFFFMNCLGCFLISWVVLIVFLIIHAFILKNFLIFHELCWVPSWHYKLYWLSSLIFHKLLWMSSWYAFGLNYHWVFARQFALCSSMIQFSNIKLTTDV